MGEAATAPVIVLAFANDLEGKRYLRNLPEEARSLRAALKATERAGLCEVEEIPNATPAELFDVFQDAERRNRVAVLHYGGHADSFQLMFESAAGGAATVGAAGLAAFLGQQSGLVLAFLNGCSTQAQAQGLLDAGVPAVIATGRAIADGTAREFAERFYKGLAGGRSLGAAWELLSLSRG